jgi:hypothetical protein
MLIFLRKAWGDITTPPRATIKLFEAACVSLPRRNLERTARDRVRVTYQAIVDRQPRS